MPRIVRDSRIETRSQRAKLKARGDPYYRALEHGVHLGYRKGKASGKWVVRRYIDGSYIVETLPGIADDTQDANGATILNYSQAIAAARTLHARQAPSPGSTGPITVATAVARYVRYLKATSSRKQARDTLRRLRRHLPAELRRRPVAELTKTILEATWFWGLAKRDITDPEAERRSKDSANRVLSMLKAALNRAFADETNGISTDKAWRTLRPFKNVSRSRNLALDAAQRQRLINTATGAFRKLLIATLYTGSRPAPGEIAQARVRDFHPALGVIHISHSKTGPRNVPLSAEAVTWFQSIAAGRHPDDLLLPKDDGTAWGYNHQLRPMREVAMRAMLPKGASMYTLRHTFATEHIMRGADLISLSELMGTSVRMLEQHYAHVIAARKREIVETTGFKLGIKPEKVTEIRPRARA
jgi:site-specific recombinase XerD